MYIMYVDESGDPGISGYSSPHFILSGLIISQDNWNKNLDHLKKFRGVIKETYGLNKRTEIHASELIRIKKIKEYQKIRKSDRINILRDYASQIPVIFSEARVINICLRTTDFTTSGEIQETAWRRLIERYDTFLKKTVKDKGIIVSDDTDSTRIMLLMRKMRISNSVKSPFGPDSFNAITDNIIEDIFQRSSHHSFFIQTVDIITQLLYRMEYPKGSLRKFGIEKQFIKLSPILLKEASKNDPLGIVRK